MTYGFLTKFQTALTKLEITQWFTAIASSLTTTGMFQGSLCRIRNECKTRMIAVCLFFQMQSRALDDLPTLLNKVLPLPDGIQFHDWLFAARGASVNGIIYLDKALVQYRIQLNVSADVLPKADVRRRSKNQRYREFRTRLHWIETLMKSLDEKFPSFYQELHSLYERSPGRNLHGRFCFSWLSMHLSLFAFNPKNYLSTLIDIRKMSRGEKTADAKIESK